MDVIRASQEAILSNQHEHHRIALASQDDMLRVICTSVEMTMRRAAHEQRGGRSMAFDAMCAMREVSYQGLEGDRTS